MAKAAASDPTNVPSDVPEDRVHALYGLPLDRFIAARDDLAKELRRENNRAGADWVKGLRKPSAPAWVVNQLVRTQGREAEELESAGVALRGAHEQLLTGEGRVDTLREAAARQGRAAAALVDKARGLLDESGNPPSRATLEKSQQTLEAVALDEDTQSAFALGRLSQEARSVGLGSMPGVTARSASVSRKAETGDGGERSAKDAKRRAELRKALEAAKREERGEQRAVESAEHETEEARRAVERAEAALEQAEEELKRARARGQQASRKVGELEQEVTDLA